MLTKNIVIFAKDLAGSFVNDPTVDSGDYQISLDGAAFVDLANLPTVRAGTPIIDIVLSDAEIAATTAVIRGVDQTAVEEWAENYTPVSVAVISEIRKIPRAATESEGGDAVPVTGSNFGPLAGGTRTYEQSLG